MLTKIDLSISIEKSLFKQAELIAQELNLSQNQLLEMAITEFINHYQSPIPADSQEMAIHQGDIYWLQLDNPDGLSAEIPHPHVLIQDDVFNHSRIPTVIVCAITSNLKRVSIPGNILLEAGEANLPKQSVIEVSKVSTVDKSQLSQFVGSLSEARVHQILDGMRFLQQSFFNR